MRSIARKSISQLRIPLVLLLTILAGYAFFTKKVVGPRDNLFPFEWVGNIDRVGFNEPSGIVFHPQRGTLFVVGDEGDIGEMQPDGTLVKQARVRHADFEDVTYDPSTGLLYVAIEGEEKIIEIAPEDFRVIREFAIDRVFEGTMLLKPGGGGVEAITFVPDPNHPQGGTFYLTNQSFDPDSREDPSVVFEAEVPIRSNSTGDLTAKIIRYFSLGVSDLSGLHYDRASDHLYVISDTTNTFFEITRAGKVLRSYTLPGEDQEGITMDGEGFLYIAQDSGGIIKIKWTGQRRTD